MKNHDIWDRYLTFHKAQVSSMDMDPSYSVLKEIGKSSERKSAVWLTFLHVAYYHMGSALKVWEEHPLPVMLNKRLLKLPCGIERRNHRKPERLESHISSLVEISNEYDGLDKWVDAYIADDPQQSWSNLQSVLTAPWGNGRWAAYKTSEMLWKVNNYRLQATDMGHEYSSGPREGLKLIFPDAPTGNSPEEVQYLDALGDLLVEKLRAGGAVASVETAETSLCDFHSMIKGRYYTGIDIDHMQEQLLEVPSGLTEKAFLARKAALPNKYLGELNGWVGVRKELKNAN
jgi:hypothetical protein